MWLRQIRGYLFPGAAESEDGFRQLIRQLSVSGLKVAAGVTVGVTVFLTLSRFIVQPEPETLYARLAQTAAVAVLGLASLWVTRTRLAQVHARGIAIGVGLLLTAVLTYFALALSLHVPSMEDYIPGQATLILLVIVAALPLRPMQALLIGMGISVIYIVESTLMQQFLALGSGPIIINVLFINMLALLATGLAAVLYRQRYLNYQAYVRSLQAAEELRRVETRMLITDHAASIGKLAAALAHELNSPIGALKSAVDTLVLVGARMATKGSGDQERLVRLHADLRKSIHESSDRLLQLVARMQRFSNLDKAEVIEADMNELMRDALAMVQANMDGRINVDLDLAPLPLLLCRPTQMSAVFHGLFSNAVNAMMPEGGRLKVRSRSTAEHVEILVEDTGRGMSRQELKSIFDPRFQISGERIASGNWSMFGFRSIVREHGGEISVESEEGQGTRIRITLPCEACLQESTV